QETPEQIYRRARGRRAVVNVARDHQQVRVEFESCGDDLVKDDLLILFERDPIELAAEVQIPSMQQSHVHTRIKFIRVFFIWTTMRESSYQSAHVFQRPETRP